MQSAVTFESNTRIHIGLTVQDLAASTAFYKALFGQEPTKVRPGYAKFEVADPAVNLTMNQQSRSTRATPSVSHFGIQVKSTDAVAQMTKRWHDAGLEATMEQDVTCCYAVQTKAWVTDPDGNPWEVFVVLQADTETSGTSTVLTCCEETTSSSCCTPSKEATCCQEAVTA